MFMGSGPLPGRNRSRGGWTLLEIVISTLILLVVLIGFSYGLASSTSLDQSTRAQGIAREAARAKLDELRAAVFEDVFARFNDNPDDDPLGVPSPGSRFDVRGLAPRPDDADGSVGAILFPVSEDGELREDLELPRLGMPRDMSGEDMDGDGVGDIDALDHASDYRVLPVLVRLEWRGGGGDSMLEMATILKRMRP
jgi:type II secretory pathway pseudopilin PulG